MLQALILLHTNWTVEAAKGHVQNMPPFHSPSIFSRVGFSPPLCTNITSTLCEFKLSGIHSLTEAKHKRWDKAAWFKTGWSCMLQHQAEFCHCLSSIKFLPGEGQESAEGKGLQHSMTVDSIPCWSWWQEWKVTNSEERRCTSKGECTRPPVNVNTFWGF